MIVKIDKYLVTCLIFVILSKMSLESTKKHINDVVYNNSNNAYGSLTSIFSNTILGITIQRQIYEYIDSLKNINGNAFVLLGEMHYYGFYVKQDYKKSVEMYYKAIALDDSILGHYNIAYMYGRHGQDVNKDKDNDMAIKHYTIAANGGCVRSQYNLGIIYSATNIHKATEWYEMAAVSKSLNALHKLAELYINTDVMKALRYYKLAIERKDEKAKVAYDKIVKGNANYAYIQFLSIGIDKMKEENNALKIQIEGMRSVQGKTYEEA
jgi:TPR repeat protein